MFSRIFDKNAVDQIFYIVSTNSDNFKRGPNGTITLAYK